MEQRIFLFFQRNREFLIIAAAAGLANIFAWLFVLLFLKGGKVDIILHYNILFGVDYQGSPRKLFTIPAVGLAIFFLNLTITRFLYKRERFISYLLLSGALVSQIFAIIALVAIILINGQKGRFF